LNKNSKKILIFGLHFPEPRSTAAGTRMLQLIHLFQDFHFQIHFACAQPSTDFSINLKEINVSAHILQLNDNSAKDLLYQLQPEIVIFDRFITEEQFGWMVDETCPEALKILDTEDLHFLRENRQNIIKNPSHGTCENTLTDKAKRELAAIYRCDLNLMISKVEIDFLIKEFNFARNVLVYLPFILNTNKLEHNKSRSYSERKNFVSIGNFKHPPNLDMVKHLHQTIWPSIRKALPLVEWHIYGAYLPQQIEEIHNIKKGIIVKGRADEVTSTLQEYKVMLAPLRFGAGLKGKCIDSMLAGTPSVTSLIGSEGIIAPKDWPGFVADNIETFCSSAVKLYQNQELWESKHNLGHKVLKAKFEKNNFKSEFKEEIDDALKHLELFRRKNTIGEILKHHHHRSTKYLSLWIQEKNRNKI
jgi:hypothetical protein